MKKHNILKVILLSILVVFVCTWIFPSISFDYQAGLQVGERAQLGIFDFFNQIPEIQFPYFAYIILVVLAIGMFYGVSYRIPAYRALLDKIVKSFSGKESIFLALSIILIALIVSVTGISFGILFVFPFVISIILLMGYNKLVAASVTVGATMIGMIGTTLGVSATYSYYSNGILGTDIYTEMITRIILLAIGLVLLIYHVTTYAKKTKNGTDKVLELVPAEIKQSNKVIAQVEDAKIEVKEVSSKKKEKTTSKKDTKSTVKSKTTKDSKTSSTKKTTKKTKAYDLKTKEEKVVVKSSKKVLIWPYALIFDFVLIVMAVSMFDWNGIFEVKWFSNALEAIQNFKIAGFPIFSKILGQSVTAFGQWSLNYEIPLFIILITCLLAFIYGLKFDEFLDAIIDGIKKALRPAIYMFLIYLVLIITVTSSFHLHIVKFLLDLFKGFNVITMTFVAMISSIFSVDNTNVVSQTLPYVTTVITDTTLYPLISVIFQAIYGLAMLIAPTSVILLGTLTYLDVSYGQWFKHIWKLFLELLVILVIIFFILFLI